MKTRSIIFSVIALLALVVANWFYRKAATEKQQQTPNIVQESHSKTVAVPRNLEEQRSANKNPSSDDVLDKYKQGLIAKDEAMLELEKRRFNQPQSFFGKLVDQDGNPVDGATITGTIETLNALRTEVNAQTFETQSDPSGLFEFTGKTGAPIKINARKEGYLIGGHGNYYQGPPGEKTTTYNRAILTMWKLRGLEPLKNYGLDAKIPSDGTPVRFDIVTGKESAEGDLRVTLVRFPLAVKRGRDLFDWTARIEMVNGGLVEENDPYPFWAPKIGYLPSYEFSVRSNNVPWESSLTKDFYIKTATGQYGRMQANIFSALTPARIQFNFTINPSGSQNLEMPVVK